MLASLVVFVVLGACVVSAVILEWQARRERRRRSGRRGGYIVGGPDS